MQAKSDLSAALAVHKPEDASTYCQALAKYQQVTEKSIKGIVAALAEIGIPQATISGSHKLEHEMNALDAIRRKKSGIDRVSLGTIDQILRSYKSDIIWLSLLAPSGLKGAIYPKNTEYPFGDLMLDEWTAPADPDAFTVNEVKRAHSLAWPLQPKAAQFVSALRRVKQKS